ncbi:hypothetical protein ACFFS2_33730 [Streptomyces aurantiacus]|uniref:hypothetical protein n=1 Tax=Streptomyces aurantiacus TaxID=47760 RepID=UPI001688B375|nr:hypothetical protein [Streptomyces aurantiacus]
MTPTVVGATALSHGRTPTPMSMSSAASSASTPAPAVQRSAVGTSAPAAATVTPVRALTPARALAPVPAPAAVPPAGQRPAPAAAVPLRRPAPVPGRPASPGNGPAVQRTVAPAAPTGHGVPLLATAAAAAGAAAATAAASRTSASAAGTAPRPQPLKRTTAYPPPAVVQRQAVAAPRAPVTVQRDLHPTPATTTAAVSHVSAHSVSSRQSAGAHSNGALPPPAYTEVDESRARPPKYTAVAKGQFDPRSLTDFQLDELTHRLIGRITRLLRTELRLDRERIGKLRDPRR